MSDAEYEYAELGGMQTKFPWGDEFELNGKAMANCLACNGKFVASDGTTPVGSFPPNQFGLYDMVGNVWEWTEDCPHDIDYYSRGPSDGSAWIDGNDCALRIARGGSWDFPPGHLGASFAFEAGSRNKNVGFRAARTLIAP